MLLQSSSIFSGSGGSQFNPQPRPLKFISQDGKPYKKRPRINAACQTCRKRKTRCSGERPNCSTCSDSGHTCLGYLEPKGLPTFWVEGKGSASHGEDEDEDREHDHHSLSEQEASPISSTRQSPTQKRKRSLAIPGKPSLQPVSSSDFYALRGNITPSGDSALRGPGTPDRPSSVTGSTSDISLSVPNRLPYFHYSPLNSPPRRSTPPPQPRFIPGSTSSPGSPLEDPAVQASMQSQALFDASESGAIQTHLESESKHTLLLTAANQDYQRCCKRLEPHWAGTTYIVTVLDQKVRGVGDPSLYTMEEIESALELPCPERVPTRPGWRRQASLGRPKGTKKESSAQRRSSFELPPGNAEAHDRNMRSSAVDSLRGMGWSLNGSTNSTNSDLTFPYQSLQNETSDLPSITNRNQLCDTLPVETTVADAYTPSQRLQGTCSHTTTSFAQYPTSHNSHHQTYPTSTDMTTMTPETSVYSYSSMSSEPTTISGAEAVMSLHSPYPSVAHQPYDPTSPQTYLSDLDYTQTMAAASNQVESADQDQSAMLFGDMMPWLDYLPQDVPCCFDPEETKSTD